MFLGELTLAAGLDRGAQHAGEVEPGAGIAVGAAGLVGQFAQRLAVEFRKDDGAPLVLHEGAAAVRDHRPGFGADAEADRADPLLFQLSDAALPVLVVGLAVAEHDQEAVGRGTGAECLQGGVHERRVVGATLWQVIGGQHGQELAQDFIIRAERTLEKGGAGKDDEADAFAGELLEEGADEQLGAFEARRLDVGREHRAREVNRDHDLAGLVEDGLLDATPLRPGEGDDGQGQAEAQPDAAAPGDGRLARRQREVMVPGLGAHDLGMMPGGEAGAAAQVPDHQGERHGEQPEEVGPGEAHVAFSFRSGGRANIAPSTSAARPGAAGQWNSSVVTR